LEAAWLNGGPNQLSYPYSAGGHLGLPAKISGQIWTSSDQVPYQQHGGIPGAAGQAVGGNGYITWVTNGTVYGGIS
jgi:hypothetical protein